MMAGKTLFYWISVFLFHFILYPVACAQHNTTTSSLPPPPPPTTTTTQASPSVRSTALQAKATPSVPTAIPSIFITLSFDISWKKFCPLSEKFRGKFSTHLIEQNKDKIIHIISAARICYLNVDRYCAGDYNGEEKAEVELYISKRGEFCVVDEDMTTRAYRILHDYVVNKKMSKIDAVFADKKAYLRKSTTRQEIQAIRPTEHELQVLRPTEDT
ncbi:uncharacterized protein LOC116289685 [Actinia tenebrosa]|uniref:Uncharacterized protein LOC116289685 n=1 Tax=Actinia tenebrosa TaxID=6105 RepID=A0A6P8HA85_ACTTE|nr:uncharacterized protein LOC116289685 [Actinia tenebrosa]